ncbi:hypothetical protein [Citrobacter freundii]|uniref:hypothetical protein n=1 Tax=Citrobacter freundii TaxID=546 RepID=UPI001FFDF4D5|nr:hypothetical protein [Citrobacter freundii]
MIHHQIFRHVVLGLCSFALALLLLLIARQKVIPLKCMGSTKTVDVTFTATLRLFVQ